MDNGIGLKPETALFDLINIKWTRGSNYGLQQAKMIAENTFNGSLTIERCSIEEPSGVTFLLEIPINQKITR